MGMADKDSNGVVDPTEQQTNAQLAEMASAARSRLDAEREKLLASEARLTALRTQLAEVKTRLKDSDVLRSDLKAQLETLKSRGAVGKKMLSFEEKMAATHSGQLEEEVKLYEDVLGLKIVKLADRRLQILFDHIAEKPAAEAAKPMCEVTLKINDDDVYEVVRTNPTLDNIQQPLELLNKTKDLRSFVLWIRAQFTTVVAE